MDFSVAVEGVEPDVARAQLAAWVAPVAVVAELVAAAEEVLAADALAAEPVADAVEEELPAAGVAVAAAAELVVDVVAVGSERACSEPAAALAENAFVAGPVADAAALPLRSACSGLAVVALVAGAFVAEPVAAAAEESEPACSALVGALAADEPAVGPDAELVARVAAVRVWR